MKKKTTVITIHKERINTFIEKINEVNRKAKKISHPGYELETVREYRSEVDGKIREVTDIKVTGDRPIIYGWEVVAYIKRNTTKYNTIVKISESDSFYYKKYISSEFDCEHCGRNIKRNSVWLLENLESGELKQVGSSCLIDFTGHPMAEEIAMISLQQKKSFGGECEEWLLNNEPDYIDIEVYFANVLEAIKNEGWVSSSEVYGTFRNSTAETALSYMMDRDCKLDEVTIKNASRIIDKTKKYIGQKENRNEYEYVIDVMLNHNEDGYIAVDDKSYIASIWKLYNKCIDNNSSNGNEFYPAEKKSKIRIEAILKKWTTVETRYGRSRIFTFESGNYTLVWMTQKDISFYTDEIIVFTAIIKDFKEYNGVNQTHVKNLNLIERR